MVHRNAEENDWEQARSHVRAKYHRRLTERQARELVTETWQDTKGQVSAELHKETRP